MFGRPTNKSGGVINRMKNIKSSWAYLVIIALAIMLLFSTSSCGGTDTPTPTTSPPPAYPSPILINPVEGATIVGEQVTEFSWQWDGTLQEKTFELRIWRSEKPAPQLPIAILTEPSFPLNAPPDGFGEYLWQVAVAWIDESGSPSTLSESLVWPLVWSDLTVKDDTSTVAEDSGTTNLNVLVNDSITPDTGEALTITEVGVGSESGAITIVGGSSINYEPAPDFFGTEIFTYTVNDSAPGADYTATVTVTVTPVNDPPLANNDTLTVTEDCDTTTLDLLANDLVAPDTSETLTITTVVIGSAGGITALADGSSINYEPAPDFFGTEIFTYTINDGTPGSDDTATVTVTVTPVNDPPLANNDTLTVTEDCDTTTLDLLANDLVAPDTSETLTITTVVIGSAGGITALADGSSINYEPAPDFFGTEIFTYTINDGTPGSDDTATVTVTVTPVNDPPVAVDDAYSVYEDNTLTIAASGVLTNDSDIDRDPITAALVSNVSSGTLSLNADGAFTYTPDANFYGKDSFTYKANDGSLDSKIATVTITVTTPATPTPMPIPTPTPTLSLLPAPILQGPPDGDECCPGDKFTLEWQWDGTFKANEFYAVRIWKDEEGSRERSRHWESDPNLQRFEVKLWEDAEYYQGPGTYCWNVVVLFDTGQTDEEGNKIWKQVSEKSETRRFVVYSMDHRKCEPP